MNQQSLENVLVSSQMRPSHSTRIVAVRKAPLDQLASLPKQVLAIGSVHPPPVRIDRLLLLVFALPMPLACLLLLRNVCSYFRALHLHQHRAAMVALVGDDFLDALQMYLRFLVRCFCPNQLGYVFACLYQSLYNRRRISLIGFRQGDRGVP